MSKIKNFVVFNSLKKHGVMNSAKALYPEIDDPKERTRLMRAHKQSIADEVGFDINDIFMALQANANHPYVPGTAYTITREDYCNYKDLYNYDVWSDVVKLTKETPNVVIGFNVSDGANVIAMNTKTLEATSTFCSGPHINRGVPFTIASTLGGNPEDIVVDISPFAHILPFVPGDLKQPDWVSNEYIWKDCLLKLDEILYIDQEKALLKQLEASGINPNNINIGEDSFKNYDYYSSQRARLSNNAENDGRFIHGVMYEIEGKERDYKQPYIKKYSVKK